jgi:hypothetical protein
MCNWRVFGRMPSRSTSDFRFPPRSRWEMRCSGLASSSSSSSYICHGVGPLVDPFRSHVSLQSSAMIPSAGSEAKGSNPTTGLSLLSARNPFRGNFKHWQVSGFLLLLSSSSLSPLCRVFIHIFLRQTMSLRKTMLQLFCRYCLWCPYHEFLCCL